MQTSKSHLRPASRMQRFLLTFVCLLLFLLKGVAQNQPLSCRITHDPMDRSAKEYVKRDINGDMYALVKVRPSASQFTITFGSMKKLDGGEHDGETWIYVQKNARVISISGEGYTPIRNQDLGMTLVGGETYVLELVFRPLVVKKQMLQFVVLPAEADAIVNIRPVGADNYEFFGRTGQGSDVSKLLEYGSYAYQVVADRYVASEGVVSLNNERETKVERVELSANFAQTTIRVDADADIYIDNEQKGRGSWTGTLTAGNYNVEARMPNYRPSVQTITVRRGESQTFTLAPPTPITGIVSVISTPSGARIEIDGKTYGTTPRIVPDVLVGSHTVRLTLPDHKAEEQTVRVEEDQTAEVNVALSQMATMTIDSRPAGATLYIDGQAVGTTPHTAEMASGDYDLRLVLPKHKTFERRVHLDSSSPSHRFTLPRQYQNPTAFYLHPTLQVGTGMAVGAGFGAYLRNLNVQFDYLAGMGTSEDIYWNYEGGGTPQEPVSDSYKMASAIGVKLGYGIVCGTRLRLTPQLGLSSVSISGSNSGKGYALSASLGARAEYALSSAFGLYAAPEVSFAASLSDFFKQVSEVSSKVKGWAGGFNLRIGAYVYF